MKKPQIKHYLESIFLCHGNVLDWDILSQANGRLVVLILFHKFCCSVCKTKQEWESDVMVHVQATLT